MPKTREDVERLKAEWLSDGDADWDISHCDDFDEYRNELVAFRDAHRADQAEAKRLAEEAIDAEALEAGVSPAFYRRILAVERELGWLRSDVRCIEAEMGAR